MNQIEPLSGWTIRLPRSLHEQLKERAASNHRTLNAEVLLLIEAALSEGEINPRPRKVSLSPSAPPEADTEPHSPTAPGADGYHPGSGGALATRRIYDHWREARGKNDGRYATLSDQRRKKIQARLKEFSEAELVAAIDAVARDPWSERALHDDVTVIFRSREQVERFLEMRNGRAVGPKRTGWRLVRGSHGSTHVRDPLGTDRAPA